MDLNLKISKFRPQQFNSRFKLKHPFKLGRYNWLLRVEWTTQNYLYHAFSVLHYRSSHAPKPIRIKWRRAAAKFERLHRKIL